MFTIGDFVYSPKYHSYGLIIDYNNSLVVFREEKKSFKPCNFRDEVLCLKFNNTSYEKFKLLKNEYLKAGFHNSIEFLYTNPDYIYNTLLQKNGKRLLKANHSYLCLNTKFHTLKILYYYGPGIVLNTNIYYELDLNEIKTIYNTEKSLINNGNFSELQDYQLEKINFIQSHNSETKKELFGYWSGYIDFCNYLDYVNDSLENKFQQQPTIYYSSHGISEDLLSDDTPCPYEFYKFFDFGPISKDALNNVYITNGFIGEKDSDYLYLISNSKYKVKF